MNPMQPMINIPSTQELHGAGRLVEFVLAVVQNPGAIQAGLARVTQEREAVEEKLAAIGAARDEADRAALAAREEQERLAEEREQLAMERRSVEERIAALALAGSEIEKERAAADDERERLAGERARFDEAVAGWAAQMSAEKAESIALRKDAEALLERANELMAEAERLKADYESKTKALQAALGV